MFIQLLNLFLQPHNNLLSKLALLKQVRLIRKRSKKMVSKKARKTRRSKRKDLLRKKARLTPRLLTIRKRQRARFLMISERCF